MINIPLASWLLVIVAAALGALLHWIARRLGAVEWVVIFVTLLTFGVVLLFAHIT